jgi:hypothetical protein
MTLVGQASSLPDYWQRTLVGQASSLPHTPSYFSGAATAPFCRNGAPSVSHFGAGAPFR